LGVSTALASTTARIDHVTPLLDRAEHQGREGVVAIVAAQGVQRVFMGYQRGKGTHDKAGLLQFRQGRPRTHASTL
jgi:hypothetical protein